MLRKTIYALSIYSTLASDPAPGTEDKQVLTCKKGDQNCWDFFNSAFETAKKQPSVRHAGLTDPNTVVLKDFRAEFLIPRMKNNSIALNQVNNGIQARTSNIGIQKLPVEDYSIGIPVNYGCWCPIFSDTVNGNLWPTGIAASEPVATHARGANFIIYFVLRMSYA